MSLRVDYGMQEPSDKQVYVYVSEDVLAAEEREGGLLGVAGLQQVTHVLLRAPEDGGVLSRVYRSCEVTWCYLISRH